MFSSFSRHALLVVSGLAILAAGCGPPEFCRFDGVATRNGKPVEGLQITLAPVIVDMVRPPISMTDENGKFEMYTGRIQGVMRGEYTVVVEDPIAAAGGQTSDDPEYQAIITKYAPYVSELKMDFQKHMSEFELKLD